MIEMKKFCKEHSSLPDVIYPLDTSMKTSTVFIQLFSPLAISKLCDFSWGLEFPKGECGVDMTGVSMDHIPCSRDAKAFCLGFTKVFYNRSFWRSIR